MKKINYKSNDMCSESSALADQLINECHALHFSIQMLVGLLISKKNCHNDDEGDYESPPNSSLPPNVTNDIDSESLIEEFMVSLKKLSAKINSFMHPDGHEILSVENRTSADHIPLISKFQNCLIENLDALDSLKSYRESR